MRSLCLWLAVLAFDASAQSGAGANDPYGVMLRSASLAAQRTALAAILLAPQASPAGPRPGSMRSSTR